MVLSADLEWVDAKAIPPGAKVAVIEGPANEAIPYTLRVKFPADYKLPAHWHPTLEHMTVLSGTFNLGTGDKLDAEKTTALTPGSVEIMPPKTNHFIWTSEENVRSMIQPEPSRLDQSRARCSARGKCQPMHY